MNNLNIEDIENILNETSKNLFNNSCIIKFKINEAEQIQLSLSGGVSVELSYLKNRLISKSKSKSIITEIRKNSTQAACSETIINLLNDITVSKFDWNKYINLEVKVDEDIIKKAKVILKEHIEGLKEFLIEPILKIVKDSSIDKDKFNEVWKENILSNYDVVEKIDSFRSYSIIKESQSYPYLILSCKTGSIKLNENSSVNFLKVDNDEKELEKLKETERILEQYYKHIESFIYIKEIINKITILDSSLLFNEEDYYHNQLDYSSLYKKKIEKAITIDLVSGELKINSETFDLSSIDLNNVENIIQSFSEQVSKEVKDYFKEENKKIREKFNKPYTTEILNLINDFPRKGITTYVSILMGEKSTKITSNDYHKSESYGSMSSLSKISITNKIRDFIDSGLIEEDVFKASFGRYVGLILSKESSEFISTCNIKTISNDKDKELKIDNLGVLLNQLREVSSSRAISLLIKASQESIGFNKSDFNMLLEFIEKERALYRGYEDTFNNCISKIVPNIYKPLFLLNSNFASGVNQKTLKSIYDRMEN